jgi:hypothetical protein
VPTAGEYRTGATRLRQIAQAVDEHAFMLRACPLADVFAGPLAERLAEVAAGVLIELAVASERLCEMAERCSFRADVCDEYQREFVAWMNLDYNPPEPPPPQKPFPWIEVEL